MENHMCHEHGHTLGLAHSDERQAWDEYVRMHSICMTTLWLMMVVIVIIGGVTVLSGNPYVAIATPLPYLMWVLLCYIPEIRARNHWYDTIGNEVVGKDG